MSRSHDSSSEESEFLYHTSCEKCGSSDALAVYSSGWGFCYGCGHKVKVDEGSLPEETEEVRDKSFISGSYTAIPKRHIDVTTARLHGYHVAPVRGTAHQVADYRDPKSGALVAQKLRSPDKDFSVVGAGKNMPLWQQHRHREGGRAVLVTEGEIDCMVYAQLTKNRWPVVSIPNGAGGAEKVFRRQIEWLESFTEVIICFDNDDPGNEAAEACAAVLTPGKAKIMRVPEGAKDICEAVQKGMSEQLINAYWSAKVWRPDGILVGQEMLDEFLHEQKIDAVSYPWEGLNKLLSGIRQKELITLTAGTGIGKSLFCRAIASHLLREGKRVGYIALEESVGRTVSGLLSQFLQRPLHTDRTLATDAEVQACFDENILGKVCVYSHFGSMGAENLLNRIRYMRQAEGVDFVILDHLSILVSGWDAADGDERRLIDNVMTSLRSIVEQTGVGMLLVSHLRRVSNRKAHEDGGQVSMSDLRGSQAISQLSDTVIGLERDQQASAAERDVTHIRVLKNRFLGFTGSAGHVRYDSVTGLLMEHTVEFDDDNQGSDF